MIVLSDIDVILKLAACDLLDELVELFGGDMGVFRCLKSARFTMRSKRFRKKYGEEIVEKAIAFCIQLKTIEDYMHNEAFEQEVGMLIIIKDDQGKGIDIGEAQLFATTSLIADDFWIASDDKTALGALVKNAEICQDVLNRIQGKVLTFLVILDRMINHFGFDFVFKKVHPNRNFDTMLQSLFYSENSAKDGLESYLQYERKTYSNLIP